MIIECRTGKYLNTNQQLELKKALIEVAPNADIEVIETYDVKTTFKIDFEDDPGDTNLYDLVNAIVNKYP